MQDFKRDYKRGLNNLIFQLAFKLKKSISFKSIAPAASSDSRL